VKEGGSSAWCSAGWRQVVCWWVVLGRRQPGRCAPVGARSANGGRQQEAWQAGGGEAAGSQQAQVAGSSRQMCEGEAGKAEV